MENLNLNFTQKQPDQEGLWFMSKNGNIEPVLIEKYGIHDFYVQRIGCGAMPLLSKFKEQLDQNNNKPLWSDRGLVMNEDK